MSKDPEPICEIELPGLEDPGDYLYTRMSGRKPPAKAGEQQYPTNKTMLPRPASTEQAAGDQAQEKRDQTGPSEQQPTNEQP